MCVVFLFRLGMFLDMIPRISVYLGRTNKVDGVVRFGKVVAFGFGLG